MGRELKRVPLDFNWPTTMLWKGYVNPYKGQDCKSCENGYNPATQKIHDEWYGYHMEHDWAPNPYNKNARYNKNSWNHNLVQEDVDALVEAGRLWDLTRVPINDEQMEVVVKQKAEGGSGHWLPYDNGHHPTADEVNEWALKGFGHDSLNNHVCVEARAKREGVYGYCEHCKGELTIWQSKEIEELHNNWESFGPPEGEGYQLWENTSEGTPCSPVFETFEELCEWCEDGTTVFGKNKISKEEWAKTLGEELVHYKDEKLGVIWI